jgi:hypothetical protein
VDTDSGWGIQAGHGIRISVLEMKLDTYLELFVVYEVVDLVKTLRRSFKYLPR